MTVTVSRCQLLIPTAGHACLALVDVVLRAGPQDAWMIRGLRVLRTSAGGLRVAVPARRRVGRGWHDVCFPLTPTSRAALDRAVLAVVRRRLHAPRHCEPQR